MDADIILKGPRLKIQRANRHIDEIRYLTVPLSKSLHRVGVETDYALPNAQPVSYRLAYQPLQPIPETLALIIGDAVHNLRGALDHLATGIARTQDSSVEIHFPMRKKREDLISPPPNSALQKALSSIEQALPGSIELLLNEVRPANGPNESIWAFHALDNDDKHNFILPAVAGVDITVSFKIGSNIYRNAGVGFNAANPAIIAVANEPITIQSDFKTTVDVRFPPGDLFENESVVPTLTNIGEVVSKTLDAFEALIRSQP